MYLKVWYFYSMVSVKSIKNLKSHYTVTAIQCFTFSEEITSKFQHISDYIRSVDFVFLMISSKFLSRIAKNQMVINQQLFHSDWVSWKDTLFQLNSSCLLYWTISKQKCLPLSPSKLTAHKNAGLTSLETEVCLPADHVTLSSSSAHFS